MRLTSARCILYILHGARDKSQACSDFPLLGHPSVLTDSKLVPNISICETRALHLARRAEHIQKLVGVQTVNPCLNAPGRFHRYPEQEHRIAING